MSTNVVIGLGHPSTGLLRRHLHCLCRGLADHRGGFLDSCLSPVLVGYDWHRGAVRVLGIKCLREQTDSMTNVTSMTRGGPLREQNASDAGCHDNAAQDDIEVHFCGSCSGSW